MNENHPAVLLAQKLLAGTAGDLSIAAALLTAVLSSFAAVRLLRGSWTRHPADLVIAIMGGIVAAALVISVPLGSFDDPVSKRLIIGAGAFLFAFAFKRAMQPA